MECRVECRVEWSVECRVRERERERERCQVISLEKISRERDGVKCPAVPLCLMAELSDSGDQQL